MGKKTKANRKYKDTELELELVVRIINVNYGQDNEVLKNCKTLSEYARFVVMVRENKKELPFFRRFYARKNSCIFPRE